MLNSDNSTACLLQVEYPDSSLQQSCKLNPLHRHHTTALSQPSCSLLLPQAKSTSKQPKPQSTIPHQTKVSTLRFPRIRTNHPLLLQRYQLFRALPRHPYFWSSSNVITKLYTNLICYIQSTTKSPNKAYKLPYLQEH